jgi:hypothetical protein
VVLSSLDCFEERGVKVKSKGERAVGADMTIPTFAA